MAILYLFFWGGILCKLSVLVVTYLFVKVGGG